MRKGKGIGGKSGSALLITMLLTAVVVALTVAAIRLVSHEHLFSVQSANWNQTLHTAEAGIEIALAAFQQQVDSSDGFSSWAQSGDTYTLPFTDLAPDGHVAPNTAFTITVNTNTLTVQATGRMPEPRTGDMISRTVQVTVQPDFWWPFEKGLLAKNVVDIQGNPSCDSYNSEDGAYGGWNILTNCSVGSMATNSGGVTGGGSADVDGDVYVTETGDAEGDYWSGQEYNTLDVDIVDAIIPFTGLTHPAVGGGDTIVVTGTVNMGVSEVDASGGAKEIIVQGNGRLRMYVDGDFDVGTSQTLTIAPDPVGSDLKVEFYINGDIELQGTLNYNGNPANLTFYGTPNCADIHCTANNDKSLTIYAPYADIHLSGNADIFGAIVGKNIDTLGNFGFHYDESLATNGTPMLSGYDITSWKEL